MTYEVIEDIRKNRNDLSSISNIIPNKHVKTYHTKHKPELKPSQIENVLINEFNDHFNYNYIPETDDEITLDKIKYSKSLDVNLKSEIEACEVDNFDLDYCDDDGFDLESLQSMEPKVSQTKVKIIEENINKTDYSHTENDKNNINGKKQDIFNAGDVQDKLLTVEDSKDSLLFSLLATKPKRSKKNKEAEISENQEKPRKFEKKKKNRINKDNWEIKILDEDEAFEQFKQRVNNSRYIKFHYKCEKCLKGFSRNDILLRHNKQCHDKVR